MAGDPHDDMVRLKLRPSAPLDAEGRALVLYLRKGYWSSWVVA